MANFVFNRKPTAPRWPWRIVPYIQGLSGVMYVAPTGDVIFEYPDGARINSSSGTGALEGQPVADPFTNGLAWGQNNTQFARIDDIRNFGLFNDVTKTRGFVHRWTRQAAAASWDNEGSIVGFGDTNGASNPIMGIVKATGTNDLRFYFDYNSEYITWSDALSTERRGFHVGTDVHMQGASVIDTQFVTVQGQNGEFLLEGSAVHASAQRDHNDDHYRITWGAGSFNSPGQNGDNDHIDTHVFFDLDTTAFRTRQQQGYWWDPATRWAAYDEYGRTSYFLFPPASPVVSTTTSFVTAQDINKIETGGAVDATSLGGLLVT